MFAAKLSFLKLLLRAAGGEDGGVIAGIRAAAMLASKTPFVKLLLRAVFTIAPACALGGVGVVADAATLASVFAPVADAAALATTAEDLAYRASVEKWRANYENDLKSDHGWLTISGLFWLHEGENRFGSDPLGDIVLPAGSAPPDAGYFEFHHGKTTVHVKAGVPITLGGKPIETAELRPDSSNRLVLGDISLWIHASGERYTVRLQDKNSKVRKAFTKLEWFPVDESYRVTAHFQLYDEPKQIEMQNEAGDTLHVPLAGYVTFTLRGQELRLDAQADDKTGELSFVFRDLTSGKEIYGASRFLDTDAPHHGEVVLDFNKAYNPPCAYNPYTTCPLPPPQNRLRARIEAGEMNYKHDR